MDNALNIRAAYLGLIHDPDFARQWLEPTKRKNGSGKGLFPVITGNDNGYFNRVL